jgi:SAM-dependent methyltransferase
VIVQDHSVDEQQVPPDARRAALDLIDYWTPLVLRIVVDLGVVERFAAGPRRAADVAREADLHPDALGRALRALAARGVFHEEGRTYALTDIGRLFLRGEAGSVAGFAGSRSWELHAWAEADHSFRTGEPSFEHHYGVSPFAWLAAQPDASRKFDRTMQDRTAAILAGAQPLLARLPDEGVLVDVGGGNGTLLADVLTAHPALHGVVLDLPHVAASAGAVLQRAGVSSRAQVVAGNFFDPLPASGDAYVLASVLHDWPDEDAVRILRRIREVIPPEGRLFVLDAVLQGPNVWDPFKQIDLHMLILFAARERSEPEWRQLLADGGFELTDVLPMPGLGWIEARPA